MLAPSKRCWWRRKTLRFSSYTCTLEDNTFWNMLIEFLPGSDLTTKLIKYVIFLLPVISPHMFNTKSLVVTLSLIVSVLILTIPQPQSGIFGHQGDGNFGLNRLASHTSTSPSRRLEYSIITRIAVDTRCFHIVLGLPIRHQSKKVSGKRIH